MMNPKHNSDRALLQLMLRAQRLASQDPGSAGGYAMLLTIVISILILGLLSSYLLLSNINKSATAAYVEGASTFYAAESALNQRASQIRERFIGYKTPTGTSPGQTTATPIVTATNIVNCFPLGISATSTTDDFACQNYAFASSRNDNVTYQGTNSRSGSGTSFGGGGTYTTKNQTESYLAYTFVADKTNYANIGTKTLTYPDPVPIPAGRAYGGLDAQEYKYTIYATATKIDPLNPTQPQSGAAKTVLQMDFTSRIVPLFQFGVFYDGDLTMSAYSDMNIYGRVHTNKKLIFAPEGSNDRLLTVSGAKTSKTNSQLNYRITAAGDIYTYDSVNGGGQGTIRIVVPDGTPGALTATLPSPDDRAISYKSLAVGKQTPLDDAASAPDDYKLSNFAPYINNYASSTPVRALKTPELGFMRKTDNAGDIGEYYGKADLRLTMQYDRAVPFDFSSIQTGTDAKGSSCPETGANNMNIPANRNDRDTAKCNVLSKGLLNSLQQPILVMTKDNTEERDRFCTQANLNDITGITAASTLTGFSPASKDKILRALQVAIAASSTPISYDLVTSTGVLPSSTQMTFKSLLDRLKTKDASLATLDSNVTSSLPPATIAAIRSSCFLPAPIQKLTNTGLTGGAVFYDNREQRAMKYLQTNIESLTVWNRDGVYIDFGTSLTTTDSDFADPTSQINAAFDDVITAAPTTYSTDGLLFVRDPANATATTGSFQKLGLAAKDRTEGGLVLHATLDDSTYPIDPTDKKRIYDATAADKGKYQSPFGFIFNQGANLPGPMTIASDQAVYTQGDYNNFGTNNDINTPGAHQPAALMADTITALSNACMSTTAVGANPGSTPPGNNPYNVPLGQVNCVLNQNARPAIQTTVFAAYAAHNDPTCSPLANSAPAAYCADRSARSAYKSDRDNNTYYGGGLQNFMRMLEDWTTTPYGGRQTFRYRGSMVSLGIPEEFNGVMMFKNDDGLYSIFAYMIPTRDFGFDPAFNSFEKLPPLSPRAVYLEQDVFRRINN
jgi:Tfp pilus assembly protein PilX